MKVGSDTDASVSEFRNGERARGEAVSNNKAAVNANGAGHSSEGTTSETAVDLINQTDTSGECKYRKGFSNNEKPFPRHFVWQG
jgi:hypothetical protein